MPRVHRTVVTAYCAHTTLHACNKGMACCSPCSFPGQGYGLPYSRCICHASTSLLTLSWQQHSIIWCRSPVRVPVETVHLVEYWLDKLASPKYQLQLVSQMPTSPGSMCSPYPHTHTHACTHTRTHTHARTCTHTRTHMHTHTES